MRPLSWAGMQCNMRLRERATVRSLGRRGVFHSLALFWLRHVCYHRRSARPIGEKSSPGDGDDEDNFKPLGLRCVCVGVQRLSCTERVMFATKLSLLLWIHYTLAYKPYDLLRAHDLLFRNHHVCFQQLLKSLCVPYVRFGSITFASWLISFVCGRLTFAACSFVSSFLPPEGRGAPTMRAHENARKRQ